MREILGSYVLEEVQEDFITLSAQTTDVCTINTAQQIAKSCINFEVIF